MNNQDVAKCLAVIQGKESIHTAGLTVEVWQAMYKQAHELYLNHCVAILKDNVYMIEKHKPIWNRRIR